jgi:hypothetical protein
MSAEELAIHEVDIGFDTAEAAVQGVQQRAFVLIVIVGVAMNQRHRFGSKAPRRQREQRESEKQRA